MLAEDYLLILLRFEDILQFHFLKLHSCHHIRLVVVPVAKLLILVASDLEHNFGVNLVDLSSIEVLKYLLNFFSFLETEFFKLNAIENVIRIGRTVHRFVTIVTIVTLQVRHDMLKLVCNLALVLCGLVVLAQVIDQIAAEVINEVALSLAKVKLCEELRQPLSLDDIDDVELLLQHCRRR